MSIHDCVLIGETPYTDTEIVHSKPERKAVDYYNMTTPGWLASKPYVNILVVRTVLLPACMVCSHNEPLQATCSGYSEAAVHSSNECMLA